MLLAPMVALFVFLCAPALAIGSGGGAPPAKPWAASEEPLFVPGAFRLPASNGYTLYVMGLPAPADRLGSLLIFATAKNRGVRYSVPATVTETSMQADLGELGRISVTFQSTNRATSVPCGRGAIRFDSGNYEGEIHFQGEEGYTSVDATSVPGNIDYVRAEVCNVFYSGAENGPRLGAELYVRNPGLGPELAVTKRRPGAAARIVAWMSEFANGISIERLTSLRMPGKCFRYDRRLRTATVRPPAPFAGSARFDLDKKAGQRWSGDLTVDLPGKTGVSLNAPALRATLARASG